MTNRITIILTLYTCLSQIILCGVPQKTPVAVLDFIPYKISEADSKTLTDRFRNELLNTGIYQVIDRNSMEDILNEQKLQLSGCVEDSCIVQVGKLIGVKKIFTGSIGHIGEIYTVNVRLIDIESGKILQSQSHDEKGNIGVLLTNGMGTIAKIFVSSRQDREIPVSSNLILQSDNLVDPEYSKRETWEVTFFRPKRKGTYNIIVSSLDLNCSYDIAKQEMYRMSNKHTNVGFKMISTVSPDGISNQRYAIIIGCGLSLKESKNLVAYAKKHGIAHDAYTTLQHWDVE